MADFPETVRQFESLVGYKLREKSRGPEALFTYSGTCNYVGSTVMMEMDDRPAVYGKGVIQV
jgi:hypothetical protein